MFDNVSRYLNCVYSRSCVIAQASIALPGTILRPNYRRGNRITQRERVTVRIVSEMDGVSIEDCEMGLVSREFCGGGLCM